MIRALFTILFLLFTAPLWGAVALDAASPTESKQGACDPCTFAHDNGTGSDRTLVVLVSVWGTSTSSDVVGITYDGDALTKQVESQDANFSRVYVWTMDESDGLINGSATVSIDLDKSDVMYAVAMTFTGVHQTAGVEATDSVTCGGVTETTLTMTSRTDGYGVDIKMLIDIETNLAVSGSNILFGAPIDAIELSYDALYDIGISGLANAGASTVMSWDHTSSTVCPHAGITLRPLDAATTTRPISPIFY